MHVLLALALLGVSQQQQVIARLFAGTPEGPFISYSWGEHWTRLRGDTRGFAGTIDAFSCLGPWVFAGGSQGLFISEDYGESYRAVSGWPMGGPAVTSLLAARLFALEPTLFVGTSAGLYRSTGPAEDWIRVGEGQIAGAVRDLSWPGPDLFVATDAGLFRTRDKGGRFEKVGFGLPSSPLLSLAVSRFFGLEPVLFVGTDGAGLFKSEDGGEKFEEVGKDLLGKASVRALVWWGALLVVGGDRGLFLSDDGGRRFREVRELAGKRVLSIAVPGAESDVASDVIVGTDVGVFKSSDGAQSFRRVQEGMGPLAVRTLATFPLPPQDRERRSR